ncbi:MAG TPA: hypothetical protein VFK03_02080 [Candidatus Saccharimonadales bacterium]|nr:hypothetical protein [Candidatus Saccharimonadales bacterium]
MNRSTLDKLISSTGLIVAVLLLAAAGGLFYAHNFIHRQVHDQLAAEQISFPAANSPALNSLPEADQDAMSQYAGQQLLTGAQAEVFANHYIAVHLKNIGNGKTYSELSSASMANPSDQALAGKVQTVFRGETLRGLLLNAYAFDTMASVAYVAAFVSAVAGLVLLVLAGLGFRHAGLSTQKHRK